MKIELGSKVRDRVTGFKGIAVCRNEWMNGCIRIGIQPEKLDKDGKPLDPQYFDQEQVEILKVKTVLPKPTGGPQRDPARSFPGE